MRTKIKPNNRIKKIRAMSDLGKIAYYVGKMEKEGGLFKGFPMGLLLRSAYDGATDPFFINPKKSKLSNHGQS